MSWLTFLWSLKGGNLVLRHMQKREVACKILFFSHVCMHVYIIHVNESQLPSPNVYCNSFQFLALLREDWGKDLYPFNSFLRCFLGWLMEWVLDDKLRGFAIIRKVSYQNSYQNPIEAKKKKKTLIL